MKLNAVLNGAVMKSATLWNAEPIQPGIFLKKAIIAPQWVTISPSGDHDHTFLRKSHTMPAAFLIQSHALSRNVVKFCQISLPNLVLVKNRTRPAISAAMA